MWRTNNADFQIIPYARINTQGKTSVMLINTHAQISQGFTVKNNLNTYLGLFERDTQKLSSKPLLLYGVRTT